VASPLAEDSGPPQPSVSLCTGGGPGRVCTGGGLVVSLCTGGGPERVCTGGGLVASMCTGGPPERVCTGGGPAVPMRSMAHEGCRIVSTAAALRSMAFARESAAEGGKA